MKSFLFFFSAFVIGLQLQAKNVLYSDPAIQWLGRWNDSTGVGKWSGWGGSQIVFKVHGTNTVVINTHISDTTFQGNLYISYSIDNSPINSRTILLKLPIGQTDGDVSGIVNLPDTTTHLIIIRIGAKNKPLWGATQKVIIKSFDIENKGAIVKWRQGYKKLQTVGDSWMGLTFGFPRLMNRSKWELYPIANGGLKVSMLDVQYLYNYDGFKASDPPMDAIIVALGINDFIGKINPITFQKQLDSLISKIRSLQPNPPIYLIQIPKNIRSGYDYGLYGNNMNAVIKHYQNVFYISTRALENRIDWHTDDHHLDITSKMLFANFVDSAITSIEYTKLRKDTIYNHVRIPIYDSIKVTVMDTTKVIITDTSFTHTQLTVYDTITTHIPVSAYDTTRIIINDTLISHIPITVYDTSRVIINDTAIIYIPVTAYDTTRININDTLIMHIPITVYDTSKVILNDTVINYIPVTAYDSTRIVIEDTVVNQVLVTLYDTLKVIIRDTTIIQTNDTLYNHIKLSVIDMKEFTEVLNLSGKEVTIKVFPNPAGEIVNLLSSVNMARFEIYTLTGILKAGKKINTSQLQIDLKGFISEEYILKIYTSAGIIVTKLVIQE